MGLVNNHKRVSKHTLHYIKQFETNFLLHMHFIEQLHRI